MTAPAIRFYNMLIHLIKNNKLYEENVAVKNVWEKDNNIFLDIYFYRNRKSYIFDAVFIHDILDLTNEKYYQDIADFVADFKSASAADVPLSPPPADETALIIDKKIFEPIDVDLIILAFLANCCNAYTPIKKKIIFDYILEQIPQTRNLSQQYLDTYIDGIKPDEKSFYCALGNINYQNLAAVENLCREALKVCLADGRLHYREKLYLAELLQIMREAGITVDLGM